MRNMTKAALLTACLISLSAGSCAPPVRIAKPPADKLICDALAERPKIPAEYQIDWSSVQTVEQARSEHDAFVRTLRTREGMVAGYIVQIEGNWFSCWSTVKWHADYNAALP
jgi:hypothetical protein